MRACLVSDPAFGFDDAAAGRLREADLLVFRAIERVAAAGLALGLVMGSSVGLRDVIRRTISALPRQKTRQGRIPKPAFGGTMSPTATLRSCTKASQF
jgi:hypothetical protein